MRSIFSIFVVLGLIFIAGCATTGSHSKKASKEAEVYVKDVQSQVLTTSSKHRNLSCKVQSEIKEKSWERVVSWANDCVQLENFNQVERYGNHLAQHHHMGPWGAYFLSLAAENRGDMERSMWMIELALKKTPNEGLLFYQKARLSWVAEETELAAKLFEKSLLYRSDLVGARMILGQLYYRDQEFSKAKKHFSKAVELNAQLTNAWVGLAECELEDRNGEAALVALEKAIDLDPKNLDFRMKEAFIYEKVLKDSKQALSAYKKIRKMKSRLGFSPAVSNELNEKIKQLQVQIAKESPGEQVSKRSPAKEEGVSK